MIPVLAGILLLTLAGMLQSAVLSHIVLLQGTADLILVSLIGWVIIPRTQAKWAWVFIAVGVMALFSAVPIWAPLVSYSLITLVAGGLQKRIWQAPWMAYLGMVFIGSFIFQLISYTALRIAGHPMVFSEVFNLIILPGALLNLIVALPIYGFIREIANLISPLDPDDV